MLEIVQIHQRKCSCFKELQYTTACK